MLKGLSQGDKEAWNLLYDRFFQPLCYFSHSLIQDLHQAEDIAMVSLTRVWDQKRDYPGFTALKSFLYTVVRNASLDYIKHQQVRNSAATELLRQTVDIEDELTARQLEAELLKYVYDSVEALPDRAREVFHLVYTEGLSTEEISRKLQIPEQTVRNNKSRALQLLKLAILKKNLYWWGFFLVFT